MRPQIRFTLHHRVKAENEPEKKEKKTHDKRSKKNCLD